MQTRKKSKVWLHFTEAKDSKVKCLLCGQQLSITNKSTCSLIRHMVKKHPTVDIQKSICYGKRMNSNVVSKSAKITEQIAFSYQEDESSPAPSRTKYEEEDNVTMSDASGELYLKPKLYNTRLQNEIFNDKNPIDTEHVNTTVPLLKDTPFSNYNNVRIAVTDPPSEEMPSSSVNEMQLTFQAYAASVQKLSARRQTIIKYKVAKLIMLEELAEQEERLNKKS